MSGYQSDQKPEKVLGAPAAARTTLLMKNTSHHRVQGTSQLGRGQSLLNDLIINKNYELHKKTSRGRINRNNR